MNIAIPNAYPTSLSVLPSTTGISAEAGRIVELVKDTVDRVLETSASQQRLVEVLALLDEVYQECSEANWDGYAAQPATEDAYNEAFRLVRLLPSNIPLPEILPEPTGTIGLEWSKGRRLVFVVSVSGDNFITYAGLFGVNKIHGTEYFGDSLPPIVLEMIQRLNL